MTGILIVAHIPLGNAFLSAVHHVFGIEPEQLEAIDVLPDQNTEEVVQLVREAITRLDSGNGVLVLTDIAGATPANCCQHLSVPGKVAILAGLSLPMLLRALTYRKSGWDEMLRMTRTAAQSGAVLLRTDSST